MPPDGQVFAQLGETLVGSDSDGDKSNSGTSSRDILSHLLVPDKTTGQTLTTPDLRQHALLLLIVGAHSVANTLVCILAALASRPDIQERLRDEILADEDGGKTKGDTLLDSVVKEGLRLFPPLPGGTPALVPKGGLTLGLGEDDESKRTFLPENTQVYIAQHVVMTQEKYFPRATEFLPERWMADDQGRDSPLMGDRRAWVPFGYGSHACAGRVLALEELKMTVMQVVREFDVGFSSPSPGSGLKFDFEEWAAGVRDHFLTVIPEMNLDFVPRAGRQ